MQRLLWNNLSIMGMLHPRGFHFGLTEKLFLNERTESYLTKERTREITPLKSTTIGALMKA